LIKSSVYFNLDVCWNLLQSQSISRNVSVTGDSENPVFLGNAWAIEESLELPRQLQKLQAYLLFDNIVTYKSRMSYIIRKESYIITISQNTWFGCHIEKKPSD